MKFSAVKKEITERKNVEGGDKNVRLGKMNPLLSEIVTNELVRWSSKKECRILEFSTTLLKVMVTGQ